MTQLLGTRAPLPPSRADARARYLSALATGARNVLINQERVAVGVGDLEVCRPLGRHVRFGRNRETARLQSALQFPHILEIGQGLLVFGPSRVKSQNVLFEHSLKKPDPRSSILKNDPILCEV